MRSVKLLKNWLLALAVTMLCVQFAFAADSYDSLREEYEVLALKPNRQQCNALGDRFYKVYTASPANTNADNALLYAGKSYKLSFEQYNNNADADIAIKYFRITYTNFDTSAAAEAYLESAEVFAMKRDLASAQFTLNRLKSRFPNTIQESAANSMLVDIEQVSKNVKATPMDTTFTIPATIVESIAEQNRAEQADNGSKPAASPSIPVAPVVASNGTIVIKDIRYYSGDDYTRVVLDVSDSAVIEKHWLPANPSKKLPPRLFIDIFSSKVESSVAKDIAIKDGVVKSVRWAYNRPGVTRVVLDSEAIEDFTIFQMSDPARIVVDLSGKDSKKTQVAAAPVIKPTSGFTPPVTTTPPIKPSGRPTGEPQTLASAFGLKIKTIVIDPGHGGKDPGANYAGINEKDIVLDVSKQLKQMLNASNKDITVYLTRDKDIFIPLEERTAIANKYKADIFISVHVNAARNTTVKGMETYVLSVTNDKAVLELAAFENKATTKSLSDLQGILKDIMTSSKLEESLRLAGLTQGSLVKSLKLSQKEDLGVKKAPFYVLVGAKMPAILVEMGFLSNADDLKKLKTATHRKVLAKGLHDGVVSYINKYNK